MPLPFLAAAPAALATAKTALGWGGTIAIYTHQWFREKPLPEMYDEVERGLNVVHADSEALVIDSTEKLTQLGEKDEQLNVSLGGEVTRFGSELTSLEERKEIPVISSPEPQTEALRGLAEAQARHGESISRQQVDMSAISDKLDNLPALLRVGQENKALKFRNETLEFKIDALEKQLAETSRYAQQTNAFAKEQQAEIDEQQVEIEALQKQLRAQNSAENKENAPTSVSFFART